MSGQLLAVLLAGAGIAAAGAAWQSSRHSEGARDDSRLRAERVGHVAQRVETWLNDCTRGSNADCWAALQGIPVGSALGFRAVDLQTNGWLPSSMQFPGGGHDILVSVRRESAGEFSALVWSEPFRPRVQAEVGQAVSILGEIGGYAAGAGTSGGTGSAIRGYQGRWSRSLQEYGISPLAADQAIVAAYMPNQVSCEVETRYRPAPRANNGCRWFETGQILQAQSTTCPSGIWTEWADAANQCVCSPPAPQDAATACAAGETGTVSWRRSFDCMAGDWGAWVEIGRTCTPPPCNWITQSLGAGGAFYMTSGNDLFMGAIADNIYTGFCATHPLDGWIYIPDISRLSEFRLVETRWDDWVILRVNGHHFMTLPWGDSQTQVTSTTSTVWSCNDNGCTPYDSWWVGIHHGSGHTNECELSTNWTANTSNVWGHHGQWMNHGIPNGGDIRHLLVNGWNNIRADTIVTGGGESYLYFRVSYYEGAICQ